MNTNKEEKILKSCKFENGKCISHRTCVSKVPQENYPSFYNNKNSYLPEGVVIKVLDNVKLNNDTPQEDCMCNEKGKCAKHYMEAMGYKPE